MQVVVILYLEGQEELVTRSIRRINRVTIWVIGVLTYSLSAPDPPSSGLNESKEG